MSYERLRLDAERPNRRLIEQAANRMRQGAYAIVPTETTYALMCLPEAVSAQTAVFRLRQLDDKHLWTLMCKDLSQASSYVHMDNSAHRLLKRCLPGPFTFILPASGGLPKRVFGKRRDIGIRISESASCQMLLDAVDGPLLTTTLQFSGQDEPAMNNDEIHAQVQHDSVVFLDVGWLGMIPTTVIDLCDDEPLLLRQGLGVWDS